MQQWEYINVLGDNDAVFVEGNEPVTIQTFLANMGRSGWELIAVTPHTADILSDPWCTYRFKRPIQHIQGPERSIPTPPEITKKPPPTLDDIDDLEGGFAFGGDFFGRG